MNTHRMVSATRAIGCFIAIFSFSSFATDSPGEAKIGEHFKVVPAANGTDEVTLVGNGLNYQDTNGAWIQSIPLVQSFPNGIVCTGASYRVILATNLNSSGSVDLELPGESATSQRERMVSHPLGLAFYDPDSGATVLLAQLKDCSAQVVSNQVIFADAFVHSNGIQASVTYTYGVGHFHQDVTLTTKPSVTPSDFAMGPNARLEMLTQFEQSPEPEVTESTVSTVSTSARTSAMATGAEFEPAVTDQTLNYGTMRMGRGRAFSTGAASPLNGLTVTKQLISVENQNFLTEDVPWAKAAETLQNLPEASGGTIGLPAQASLRRTMPRESLVALLSARGSKPLAKTAKSFKERLAETQRSKPLDLASLNSQLLGAPKRSDGGSPPNSPSGFVLDYELVQSCTNFTFQSSHTYLISGYVQIGYVTIESGAVIKFSSGDLEPITSLTCPDDIPRAVLTDMNDNSVGASISNSVGHFVGFYTFTPLNLSGLDGYGAYIHNLDIRFMGYGIVGPTIEGNYCYIYDNWFFKCSYGIGGSADFIVGPSGCDFCEVDTPFPPEFSDPYPPYGTTYCSVDRNANGLPDDWEFNWFANFSHTTNQLDADGHTLLYNYQHSLDPNSIGFSIGATNSYCRTNFAPIVLNVTVGTPISMAVLVSNTNFSGATWTNYISSNLTANLGTTDGVYSVWIGLRGRWTNSVQTWHEVEFTRDRVSPVISITNIASGSKVSRSLLQVQGSVSEPAASLVYDLTNVTGATSNQEAYITGTSVDTNLMVFTTNYFQAYDVFLASGTNLMTFRATDLAGNVSTTNLVIVLDTSTATNAPSVSVNWPDTNKPIAGTNFVLSGTVNDPTATVLVSGNGFTNYVATVERDGRFTLSGVPLLQSNNTFTVAATNKAGVGISSSANGPSRSGVQITVNPIQSSQVSHDFMTLTGTVSDTNKDVWVNGVKANASGTGTWQADNVPVKDNGGSQQLNIGAYPSGSDPNSVPPSGVQNPMVALPPIVQASSYVAKFLGGNNGSCGEGDDWLSYNYLWERGTGGEEIILDYESERTPPLISNEASWGTADYLPVSSWGNSLTNGGNGEFSSHLETGCPHDYTSLSRSTESVQTEIEVVAGGPAVPGEVYLIRLTASASGDQPILGSDINVMGQAMTPTATNENVGELYLEMLAGSSRSVPVSVAKTHNYNFDVHAETISLKTLTIVSNSATKIDSQNWAAIKTTNDFVILQATLSSTNENSASQIHWDGGEAIPGSPFQRRMSKAVSVQTNITVTIGSKQSSLTIWILWGTVAIFFDGTNPSPINFPWYEAGNQLGPQYYYVTNMSSVPSTTNDNFAVGKICVVATITPAGVHSTIKNGWAFHQFVMTHTFIDGLTGTNAALTRQYPYSDEWHSDGPTNDFQTVLPDSSDKLYAIDGPNIARFRATHSAERYLNFYDYISWNSNACSTTNNFWHFEGRYEANQTNHITFLDVGTNLMTLPTSPFYSMP